MTCAVPDTGLLSPRLSNEFLFDRLMEHHNALLDLQAAGIVQTNFMKCDENSIYVFASLLECVPTALTAERFEIFNRHRNGYFVERCAYHLRNGGEEQAADLVDGMVDEAQLSGMTQEDALLEHRKAYLSRLLKLCHGLLVELVDRKLVSFGSGQGYQLSSLLIEGYETSKMIVQVKPSHLSPKDLFERISENLKKAGFFLASERAVKMSLNLHYL